MCLSTHFPPNRFYFRRRTRWRTLFHQSDKRWTIFLCSQCQRSYPEQGCLLFDVLALAASVHLFDSGIFLTLLSCWTPNSSTEKANTIALDVLEATPRWVRMVSDMLRSCPSTSRRKKLKTWEFGRLRRFVQPKLPTVTSFNFFVHLLRTFQTWRIWRLTLNIGKSSMK